jgi:hypothetical protein
MPAAGQSFEWQEALATFAIIIVASFLVTWVVTGLLRMARNGYIAILGATVLGLSLLYLAWSGTSVSELLVFDQDWAAVLGC